MRGFRSIFIHSCSLSLRRDRTSVVDFWWTSIYLGISDPVKGLALNGC